jgi:hypothetical protein
MKKTVRWLPALLVAVSAGMTACADNGTRTGEGSAQTGTLALPLTSTSPAGIQYRLRNANFVIEQPPYYCNGQGAAGFGGGGCQPPITLSSETDPDAASLTVDLQESGYEVYLQPGWSMERIDAGVATPVEAQLLSDSTQWIYVTRHSTTWINFQFGIGDHAIWFDGKLNIQISVYDNPDQYYGTSSGGYAGSPVITTGGAFSTAGGSPSL